MRFYLLILAISVTVPFIGCNSDLKCRRETALLRAEYLDLEDKYYSLLSQSGSTETSPTLTTASSSLASSDPAGVHIGNISPAVYGSGVQQSGVQQSIITHNSAPEIIYYDQSGGYPVQNGSYPVQGGNFPFNGNSYPVEGETYYAPIEDFGQTPTPANSTSPTAAGEGTYYPSPVEDATSAGSDSRNSEDDILPTPDSPFDDEQSRFEIEIDGADDIHEIGHEVKIKMDSPITEVLINKSVSQGKNFDSRPGDDGIELLLQPKSADGSIVDEAGDLTITLVDPSAEQGERKIGQWTFLKEEAQLFFAEDEFDNRGILLSLKWDNVIPTNKRLTAYVRFKTVDGRVMETTSDLFIDPPKEFSITDRRHDDDPFPSDFVRVERDADQGWYKSQTNRGRIVRESDQDWGRTAISERAIDDRRRLRQFQGTSRQPQWRPAR